MYLLVQPAGGRYWRLKYRHRGKEKVLALGVYPDVGLRTARDRRSEARKKLAEGIDPGADRKAQKQAAGLRAQNTFETIGLEPARRILRGIFIPLQLSLLRKTARAFVVWTFSLPYHRQR